jgi:hypothetical protein
MKHFTALSWSDIIVTLYVLNRIYMDFKTICKKWREARNQTK